jgi:ribosome maturation protein SDO1
MNEKERLHINLARLRIGGKDFEIIVDPDKAFRFKEGEDIDIKDIVSAQSVFYDANKGMVITNVDLKNYFHTEDMLEAAKRILKEGELQLSVQQRQQIRDEKMRRVVDIISTNAVDPRSERPHPPQRIINALEEVKFKIMEKETVEENVQRAIKLMRPSLPLKFEVFSYDVVCAPQYIAHVQRVMRTLGKVKSESYQNDGSLRAVFEFPAGTLDNVVQQLNSVTHGSVVLTKRN